MRYSSQTAIAGLLCGLLTVFGCGGDAAAPPANTGGTTTVSHEDDADHGHEGHDHEGHADAGHDHGGWWCAEHGVPEGICALCSPKVLADLKAAGDWCEKHQRPDSQCFECHPEYAQNFVAEYEAKFGEAPPPRVE